MGWAASNAASLHQHNEQQYFTRFPWPRSIITIDDIQIDTCSIMHANGLVVQYSTLPCMTVQHITEQYGILLHIYN